jgi:hypothetical protein
MMMMMMTSALASGDGGVAASLSYGVIDRDREILQQLR